MGSVVDPSTGVKFPLEQTFWDGVQCLSLGIGTRVKKVAFVGVKVYSVTMYVDKAAAKADLQARKPGSDAAICEALTAGPYTKAMQMQLVRNVTGAQFTEAFEEALQPRMKGDTAPLEAFKAYFSGKQLDNGSNVILLWRQPGSLDVLECPPGTPIDNLSQAKAGATIESAKMCQSLWTNYLEPATPAPEARTNWITGAKALMAS